MAPRKQSKPLSRPVEFVLRAFIFVSFAVAALWIALYFYPGLVIIPFAHAARTSPFCSTTKAVADAAVKVKQSEIAKAIHAKTRVVKVEGGYKLWSTPNGKFWVPDSNDAILSILLAQQERKIYGDADNGGVKAGDIVLDGGAHVGTYVRTALDSGAAKVVAIEPSPEALECLRRNFVSEIAAGRVVIYPKGIWDEEKRLVFYSNGNGAAGDSFVERGADAKVVADIPVTTIDKIVAELALPRVDIIKADIKGAGTRMVHGAVNTIKAYHPRIVVSVEEAPEDPASIKAAVMRIVPDYRFRCGPCLFTGDEIRNDTIFFQ
ncbi:MAG TPA: FkbM family methyltransferase [Bryobacteraceae bacterium]|nr:FkbM family methyltransferase [Bryobacteraceae bacterium]